MSPGHLSVRQLMDRYQTLLLDSFGVLVDGSGALDGAAELLKALRSEGRDFLIVTNDASRLPESTARRYRSLGLELSPARILTSGMLIEGFFREHGLAGSSCLVLGTDDSREYVRRAGGHIASVDASIDYDVVVVADDAGFEYFPAVDAALSAVVRRCERGQPPTLVLPNPDLIYPKAAGQFGFTAGAVALLLEAGFRRRLGDSAPRFQALGKPNRPIYERALELAEGQAVMIGDQLETDIAGAVGAGIDNALLMTGVTRWEQNAGAVEPTYLLESLAL